MSKVWRVVLVVVTISILLGAVCIGVGLITGGEWERVYAALDTRYHVDAYVNYAGDVIEAVEAALNAPMA